MKKNRVQPILKSSQSGACPIRRIGAAIILICSVIILAGTKACQEDYDLGSRTTLVGTSTPTASLTVTATVTDDGSVKTATPTGTPASSLTGTATPTLTSTIVATPTATPTLTPTSIPVAAEISPGAVRSLLSEVDTANDKSAVKAKMDSTGADTIPEDKNWLGKAFIGDSEASSGWVDSDNDGFSDELEARLKDEGEELILPESRLVDRVDAYDQDLDGFEDRQEIEQGLSPNSSDTDGDGYLDGLEVLAGSSPVDKNSRPKDGDSDGAPDVLEEALGLDLSVADTDSDKLEDRMEIVLSSDGAITDTDGDGIADGKEVDLGSDPLISDYPKM